jgi:hypothetical protein
MLKLTSSNALDFANLKVAVNTFCGISLSQPATGIKTRTVYVPPLRLSLPNASFLLLTMGRLTTVAPQTLTY